MSSLLAYGFLPVCLIPEAKYKTFTAFKAIDKLAAPCGSKLRSSPVEVFSSLVELAVHMVHGFGSVIWCEVCSGNPARLAVINL